MMKGKDKEENGGRGEYFFGWSFGSLFFFFFFVYSLSLFMSSDLIGRSTIVAWVILLCLLIRLFSFSFGGLVSSVVCM